ncbi:hypothetical protein MTsPCn9_10340 [Croceitalea sp. MTPC9]|uniref:hypothetical protein n=1 Tax=unclassified Croceitalea TaxID=2632280 RepID=UPI002B3D4B06|nr:hypothetical protein MTsPCn6_26900 [Croceitalea sp. MTPC6]GMN16098.1 hypothetical protein MTsPCn9_10340 [Croceitalea sp. MTPC9]
MKALVEVSQRLETMKSHTDNKKGSGTKEIKKGRGAQDSISKSLFFLVGWGCGVFGAIGLCVWLARQLRVQFFFNQSAKGGHKYIYHEQF